MIIAEYWPWDGNAYALYTENPEVAKEAKKSGLRLVGEYFRNDPFSEPFAWQFVGPKEKVVGVARQAKKAERTASGVTVEKNCPACGEVFAPDSPRQRYCRKCGDPKERVKRMRERRRADALG